ncbi:protein AF-9-like, partial [Sipha flava]|uniref:Protein AF-9-like n=2 Tax=Sipha flava TaxID=143950 RepID=A0A8B8GR43_9HEMI
KILPLLFGRTKSFRQSLVPADCFLWVHASTSRHRSIGNNHPLYGHNDSMKMAFPYVKVIFEIGHEASVRNKRTPEGFTHDWELFVRGADNTDIHFFIDKVVFHLHDTFPNPKRVVKEPPYVVKESGYAGFPLPIEIYVRNKEEPRKIKFNYELVLQDRGSPPISRVIREVYVFSPSEDFRRKLIKGGGISVLSHDGAETKNPSSSSAISKQKSITNTNRLPSPPPKKNKKEDMKLNNTFATLFGSPIQPSKLPLTTSKSSSQKLSSSDKSQTKIKSSPHHKEEKKEKERDKEKKKSKELSVDKVKKDKDKKEKSKESSDKSKSIKQSSSKPDKKESTHHEKVKEKLNDIKIEKKESKDKSKREDKIKEKNKEKTHKEEKSYHEAKIIKQEIKSEFNDQEKKKHKSSPESIKIKSDKKLEKSEKSSKPHKSHKEHKKRDKRNKEERLSKKEEKSNFVEQDTSFKHLDVPQTITSIEEFPKLKEEIPECSPPPKANSSRIHEPESEEEFLSEDSDSPYQPPEPPKPKELEPPKKKLSPENSFIKKKKRKKKERDSEESKPKSSRPEITEQIRETCSDLSRSPSPSPSNNKFTDEYINSLKHLQHKIMMLEDEDLQRVVTVIAETGHYEITTKTFDFDLCALNETTVKKLQELIT